MLFWSSCCWSALGSLQPRAPSLPDRPGVVTGVLYAPEGKGPFPALRVIHEWWGLNDWVKVQASKLADQGYAA